MSWTSPLTRIIIPYISSAYVAPEVTVGGSFVRNEEVGEFET